MKKHLAFSILLILVTQLVLNFNSLAQDIGYFVRSDCGTLSPAPNGTVCLQSTTTGGRTAGTVYVWNGSSWTGASGGSSTPGGGDTEIQYNDAGVFNGDSGITRSGSGELTVSNDLLVGGDAIITGDVVVTGDVVINGNSVCQEDGTNCPSSAAPSGFDDILSGTNTGAAMVVDTGASLSATGSGTIAATSVTSADLAAVEALVCTGGAYRTAANTWICRTITGTSNNITVTNGDGVSGNPSLDLGSTAVQTDQSNTYTTGTQSMAAATALVVPGSAGSPTAAGSINFNTSTLKPQMGNGTTTLVLSTESGNVATATALAANGANCNNATGSFAVGVNASGACEGAAVALSGAAAPSAATVEFPGQNYVDTRSYSCSTAAGLPYVGATAGGNFLPIAGFNDGYTTFSDGSNTSSPCGSDTFKFEASSNITPTVTSGSPDKVVHLITISSQAQGDVMYFNGTSWVRLGAGTNGHCLKTQGAGANPQWASCASTTISAYWDANAIVQDGTNCTDPSYVTINSGPKTPIFVCADSNSSVFEGKLHLDKAITTAVFTLSASDVDSSSQVLAVNVDAQCRGDGTAINSTFGTAQSISITMPTANNIETASSAAVTPNGTCGAGATLFWRATVLGTTTNTDDGDARILGMFMAGS